MTSPSIRRTAWTRSWGSSVSCLSLLVALSLLPLSIGFGNAGVEIVFVAAYADDTDANDNSVDNPDGDAGDDPDVDNGDGTGVDTDVGETDESQRRVSRPENLSEFLSSLRNGSQIVSAERDGDNIEIRYSDGWEERIRDGEYILLDPNANTIIRRPASPKDYARLNSAF